MKHMNGYDIARAAARFDPDVVPNRARLVAVIDHLAQWTCANSDGWAYWAPPRRAAQRAIALVESTAYPEYERREREDITDAEVTAALRPIKAFLTKHRDIVTDADRAWILAGQ